MIVFASLLMPVDTLWYCLAMFRLVGDWIPAPPKKLCAWLLLIPANFMLDETTTFNSGCGHDRSLPPATIGVFTDGDVLKVYRTPHPVHWWMLQEA